MNKLLACACLATVLSACGGKQPPAQPQPPVQDDAGASAEAKPAAPPQARTFADSAAETGWFRLRDGATFAVASASHRCSIERINGEKPARGVILPVSLGKDLTINGWVADPQLRTPERFLVVLRSGHGTYATNATAGRKRPDVAAALKSELLADSGFVSRKPLDVVAPGEYSVSLLEFVDGEYSVCSSAARIAVAE